MPRALRRREQYKMSVLPLYAEDYTQTAIFVWNTLFSFLKVLAFRGSRDNRFPLRSGASHECRNNFLWGGHPEYTLALTGNTSCPTRKCICTIGMLSLDRPTLGRRDAPMRRLYDKIRLKSLTLPLLSPEVVKDFCRDALRYLLLDYAVY